MSRAVRQCSDLHLWVHLSGDEEVGGIAPILVLSEWLAFDGLTPEQFFHTATFQMRLQEFTIGRTLLTAFMALASFLASAAPFGLQLRQQ